MKSQIVKIVLAESRIMLVLVLIALINFTIQRSVTPGIKRNYFLKGIK